MADGQPKDYSSEYNEEYFRPPVPPIRQASRQLTPMRNYEKPIEGKHRAMPRMSSEFLNQVYAKLQPYSISDKKLDKLGMDVLNQHYDTVFQRKKTEYKVYIQYFKFDNDNNKCPQGETYVVRVARNSFKLVKNKLPNNRGNFRYFFKDRENACHEIESEDSEVPYLEKDGVRTIYCQVLCLTEQKP